METNKDFAKVEQIATGLRKVLNMHGHSFQYAVLRRIDQLFTNRQSTWIFEGSEFPVVVNNESTHIDIILRSRTLKTYLIGECKRVDPAIGNWCFARAPYTSRNPAEELIFDQFICNESKEIIQKPCTHGTRLGIYHLGFELRTGKPGDGVCHDRSSINQTVAQVLRCSSGLINHLFLKTRSSIGNGKIIRFMPVVFTTANLWVTSADLSAADLETGDLPVEAVKAEKVDWLWYNYNRSTTLRHNLELQTDGTELSKELKMEFTRSIAFISTIGIDKFMQIDMDEFLDP
jgi:hypothetical protein